MLANRSCYRGRVNFSHLHSLRLKWCTYFMTYFKTGISHRHVQTHEFPGRPEDHGWDKESDQSRSIVAGQLLGQNTGLNYGAGLIHCFNASYHWFELKAHVSTILWLLGSPKHGSLCWPKQPYETSGDLQAVDRSHHGGVFHPGWQGARQRHGN